MPWWLALNVLYVINFISHTNVWFNWTTTHITNCYDVVHGCIFPSRYKKMQLNQCAPIALALLSCISTFLANSLGITLHCYVLLFSKAPTIEHALFYNAHCSHPWQHHCAFFSSIMGTFLRLNDCVRIKSLHVNLVSWCTRWRFHFLRPTIWRDKWIFLIILNDKYT